MFQNLKNIDTAFRHVRLFTLIAILANMGISAYTIYACTSAISKNQETIYLLNSGKVLEAFRSERKENIPVEARDHVESFHRLFFSLDPDEKLITANIKKALYLSDMSAKKCYDDLKEKGYYTSIVSGNMSQTVETDSILVDTSTEPYTFKYYGKQKIVRPTAIVTRTLTTQGFLRNISRSDQNPHGFLIEKWEVVDNRELKTTPR